MLSGLAHLPTRYRRYVWFYLLAFPLFLLSFYYPGWESVYAILFFVLSIGLIFNFEEIPDYPQHSSLQHFEYASRSNAYNYVVGFMLILAAFIYLWLPIHHGITIFMCWTVGLILILFLLPVLQALLGRRLMVSYLSQKLPDVDKALLHKALAELSRQPGVSSKALAQIIRQDVEVAEKMRHYILVYYEANFIGDNE